MGRILVFLYGVVSYVVFLGSFLYAIAFVGGFGVPRTVDAGGPAAGTAGALAVNTALLLLFAVQHSVMARPGFKRWWTRIIPKEAERSTYVLLSSLLLIVLFWQWRPMPGVVWEVEGAAGRYVFWGIFALGWALVLVSTFLIDHFDLFGLKQVWCHLKGREYRHPRFRTPFLYRYVRHPLLLGFMLAFWATPAMTMGHLLFAVATTGYTLVGVRLEERDLVGYHGEAYERYRKEVPMFVPRPGRTATEDLAELDRVGRAAETPEPGEGPADPRPATGD